MAERATVPPANSPRDPDPNNRSGPGSAFCLPADPAHPDRAHFSFPSGTYVVQVPKDQIYRVPPTHNSRIADLHKNRPPPSGKGSGCCKCFLCLFLLVLIILIVLGIIVGISIPLSWSYNWNQLRSQTTTILPCGFGFHGSPNSTFRILFSLYDIVDNSSVQFRPPCTFYICNASLGFDLQHCEYVFFWYKSLLYVRSAPASCRVSPWRALMVFHVHRQGLPGQGSAGMELRNAPFSSFDTFMSNLLIHLNSHCLRLS